MFVLRPLVFLVLAAGDSHGDAAAGEREAVEESSERREAEEEANSLWERYFASSGRAESLKEQIDCVDSRDHEALKSSEEAWRAAQEEVAKFWDLFAAAEEFAGGLRESEEEKVRALEFWLSNSTTSQATPGPSSSEEGNSAALTGRFEGQPDSYVDFASRLGGSLLGGPNGFSVAFTARWDELERWSRVVDFGNGARGDNIIVANEKDTDALAFHVYSNGTNACLTILGGITKGAASRYLCSIDASGHMRVVRDGKLIGERKHGLVPAAVPREHLYVGRSNFRGNAMFVGEVGEVCIWNARASWEDATHCAGAQHAMF